jgi:hypothetical protein
LLGQWQQRALIECQPKPAERQTLMHESKMHSRPAP